MLFDVQREGEGSSRTWETVPNCCSASVGHQACAVWTYLQENTPLNLEYYILVEIRVFFFLHSSSERKAAK